MQALQVNSFGFISLTRRSVVVAMLALLASGSCGRRGFAYFSLVEGQQHCKIVPLPRPKRLPDRCGEHWWNGMAYYRASQPDRTLIVHRGATHIHRECLTSSRTALAVDFADRSLTEVPIDNEAIRTFSPILGLDHVDTDRVTFRNTIPDPERKGLERELATVVRLTKGEPFAAASFSKDRSLLELWWYRNTEPDSKEHYTTMETHVEILRVRDGARLAHGVYTSYKFIAASAYVGRSAIVDGEGYVMSIHEVTEGSWRALVCHLPQEITK